MSKKEVVIDFDENGDPMLDGKGFVGAECAKFIGELQQALGLATETVQKPEFRQRVATGGGRTAQRSSS